eukprot:m51a1_g10738 hypothetical protein (594) ;mRNA; f:307732-314044
MVNEELVAFLSAEERKLRDKGNDKMAIALQSVRRYPLEIHTGEEAQALNGIGDCLGKRIDDFLRTQRPPATPAAATSPATSATPPPPPPEAAAAAAGEPQRPPPPAQPTPVKKRAGAGREYNPRPRSGGHALLLALLGAEAFGDGRALAKRELVDLATPLCDLPLSAPRSEGRWGVHTAWSAMKTLADRGLVVKTARPARFYLSELGERRARALASGPAAAAAGDPPAPAPCARAAAHLDVASLGPAAPAPAPAPAPAEAEQPRLRAAAAVLPDAPSFCPHCGKQAAVRGAQFCAWCGMRSLLALALALASCSSAAAPAGAEAEGGPAAEDPGPLLVFVAVVSAPANRERRDAARATWASPSALPPGIDYRFFIGRFPEELAGSLRGEQERHGDVVELAAVAVETHAGLSRKTVEAVRWAAGSLGRPFAWLMKLDDDALLNAPLLAAEVARALREGAAAPYAYWGFLHRRAYVYRSPGAPYYEPEWDDCETHMPYMSGSGYLLTRRVALYLASPPVPLRLLRNEDAAVGLWLAPLQVQRRHDARFHPERPRGAPLAQLCLPGNATMLQHRLRPGEFAECWRLLAPASSARSEL